MYRCLQICWLGHIEGCSNKVMLKDALGSSLELALATVLCPLVSVDSRVPIEVAGHSLHLGAGHSSHLGQSVAVAHSPCLATYHWPRKPVHNFAPTNRSDLCSSVTPFPLETETEVVNNNYMAFLPISLDVQYRPTSNIHWDKKTSKHT